MAGKTKTGSRQTDGQAKASMEVVGFRAFSNEVQRWREAARKDARPFSHWLRLLVLAAERAGIKAEPEGS